MSASQSAPKADSVASSTETTSAKDVKDDGSQFPPAAASESTGRSLTFLGNLAVFFLLPVLAGLMGLYFAFLETYNKPDRKLSIESDFGLPFMLMLFTSIVVGFRTGGFSSSKVEPIMKFPKIRKKTKVIHKHVIKGQNPNSISNEMDDVAVPGFADQDAKGENAKKND
jgi:hypothetical protein